ncbi:hypothetical protein EMGBS15_11910 [Filimonas sp.]|jgi:futalosine hydrolase|nr:hypothetical protein EMGBS15_11910 [Filimonas sp.]
MNISIVAATELEISGLRDLLFASPHTIEFSVHGVGLLQATYHIQKVALKKPELLIQCGIAGSYSNELLIGETVVVYAECLGDAGAEDHDDLFDLFDLHLQNAHEFPFTHGLLMNENAKTITHLKPVKSLTVNLAAGNEQSILKRRKKFNPDIETMEGACLHYVCLQENIPFIQFRGISNRVEPRDKSQWKIAEALRKCHTEINHFIHQIPSIN